jgi:hypothetical protein
MASNDTFNLKISRAQLFNLVSKMSRKDQGELLKALQDRTYLQRFEDLLQKFRTDEIAMEEISREVELVRQKRYDEGKHQVQSSSRY